MKSRDLPPSSVHCFGQELSVNCLRPLNFGIFSAWADSLLIIEGFEAPISAKRVRDMSKVTLPLDIIGGRNVSSLKALREREKAREAAGATLPAIEQFKARMDGWTGHVQSLDDSAEDYAGHSKNLVVLNQHRAEVTFGPRPYVSAELHQTDDGYVTKSNIEIETYSDSDVSKSKLTYQRTANREVYTENSNGTKVKLVLDHAKGTLTYEDPNLENVGKAAWPYQS